MSGNTTKIMFSLYQYPIQKQILGLMMLFISISLAILFIHTNHQHKHDQIHAQLENQSARMEIGISIYRRLFAARAMVYQLYLFNDRRESKLIKKHFDTNMKVILDGIKVLHNGGIFEDEIDINIPGQDVMKLLAHYNKPETEGYILEVLELSPALHNLNEVVQSLYLLLTSQIKNDHPAFNKTVNPVSERIKVIDTILHRTLEQAGRILYESQEKKNSLTLKLEQEDQAHENFRLPVEILAVTIALLSLGITLYRIGTAIAERKHAEEQLQLLFNTTAEGIYGIDAEGNTTFINNAAEKMLGFPFEDLINKDNHSLIHHSHSDGSFYPANECRMKTPLINGKTITVNNEVMWRKDGTSFPVEYTCSPIFREEKAIGVVVNFSDISSRKRAEKKIQTLTQAIEQSPVSVVITDINANIEYVNSAFVKSTGYEVAEIIGKNTNILKSGLNKPEVYQQLWKALSNGRSWQGEFQNRRKNGEIFWEYVTIAPVQDEYGKTRHYLAVKDDITLKKQQQDKIVRQANYDSLTDLPNRSLALDRLTQVIKQAQRNKNQCAVMFLDLDNFKKINDSISHEAGDMLLVQAAQRLRETVRSDDTVSRQGGDEFLILLGNLPRADEVYTVAKKLLKRFSEVFLLHGRELSVTVSIGIAVYPDDGITPAELLRNADTAMYQSKAQGKNTYNFFTDNMNREASRILQLEEQLYGALERGEFYLFYQPLIDIKSCSIIGAEALLRWKNPLLGHVSPDEFIPVTEQTGQILAIGQFVMNEALLMTSLLQKNQMSHFKIAINVSPRQFRDPNLLEYIQTAAVKANVPFNSIELEITEGVLMTGHLNVKETLESLFNLGIGIAMDDFGTGYSSLNYLRSYPFDTLKIDRSFVRDISIDAADRELVNTAIAMAHALGMKVVAEGVETNEQLEHLNNQDCELAQGYLFSKPVSAEDIAEMLNKKDIKL